MEKTVFLPDGSELEVDSNSSVEDIAYEIGTGLGEDCVAGHVNGDLVGADYIPSDGDQVSIITRDSEDYELVLRHSAAHVFAQAVERIYPDVKLAIGPPTEEGFYYDIAGIEITEDDFDDIEEEMEDIIAEDYSIDRVVHDREWAIEYYADNEYKRDILDNEADEEQVSFYEQGEFRDLCRGGHVDSTGEIGAVKLMEISSAYWRGDNDNEMLTRVYGVAFETEDEMEDYLERQRKLEERSHRRIGREMNLFQIAEHSPAPQYLPNGMIVRRELEEFIRDKNAELGYEEVWTPELNTTELFKQSGHYEAFCEDDEMFFWEQSGTEYSLKPMNCGNHAKMYEDLVESYRDLPVRLSEFGTVYRHERSGSASGLFRARGFTQDDGHAFVTKDQLESEVESTLSVIRAVASEFNLDTEYKLETRPENSVGSAEDWSKATESLENALDSVDVEYDVEDGEGAFYGPKIGVDVQDVFGREWTLGTVQVDFNIPKQLNLTYTNEENEDESPIMIHRAVIGSFERFIAILLEQTNGHLPIWLSPVRVRVLPVGESNQGYARSINDRIDVAVGRSEIDSSDETLENRIRKAHEERIPYIVIVGDDEEEAGEISVRDRRENEVRGIDVSSFTSRVKKEVRRRDNECTFVSEILD